MENKFIINDDEKRRILSLHENSTKQHYLNVISEQNEKFIKITDTYELKNQNPKGTTISVLNGVQFFKTGNPNILKTKLVSIGNQGAAEITYNCSTGKFSSSKNKDLYNNEDLENKFLKPFCKNKSQQSQTTYIIQNSHTINKGGIKIVKGDVAVKVGNLVQIKRGNKPLTSLDCTTGKFNTYTAGQVDADGGNFLRDTLMKQFCGKSLPTVDVNAKKIAGKPLGNVVIPKDIDLSQITKELPAELQTVLTPPTVDGQPNTGGQPDFNQLLTQLQGIS